MSEQAEYRVGDTIVVLDAYEIEQTVTVTHVEHDRVAWSEPGFVGWVYASQVVRKVASDALAMAGAWATWDYVGRD